MTVQEEKKFLDEPVTFLSKFDSHTHTLRARRKVIIDGHMVVDPGVRIHFKNGKFTTRDAEIVRLMEHALTYYSIGKIIRRAPSYAEYQRAANAGKEIEDAKRKVIEKFGDTKPKDSESFAHMLEKKKAETNVITGIRGVQV
jgi:hypothetical protein